MASTVISSGSEQAIKLQSVGLFAENIRNSNFLTMMMGSSPTQKKAMSKQEKMQTSIDMPIVQIRDLSKMAGDKATVDLYHSVQGKPIMGDNKVQGRGAPLRFAEMELKIDQSRFPVDAGGKMTAKRTRWNLRSLARSQLSKWWGQTTDQRILVHLAGARGSQNSYDWNVPLDTDPDFNDIMTNDVMAPTANRYFVAGGGDNAASIGDTDAITLEDLDVITATLRAETFPMTPIEIRMVNGESYSYYCLYLTEFQWHYLQQAVGDNRWRSFQAEALKRSTLSKHPLFMGEAGYWNGLIIKRMQKSIMFNPGDTIKTTNPKTGAIVNSTVASGITVHRALILGGQALAHALGDAGKGMGFPTSWSEEWTDHGNNLEVAAAQIDGFKKIRFEGTDGELYDFGVGVLDSYAPIPKSTAGASLRSALESS